ELVGARLTQQNFTGFVLVLVPERLPIEETARAANSLRDSNVNVCGIIVNRILPENLNGAFYEARRKQEQTYCEEIRRRFAEYHSIWIRQFETDVYGIKNVELLSEVLTGPNDGAPFG